MWEKKLCTCNLLYLTVQWSRLGINVWALHRRSLLVSFYCLQSWLADKYLGDKFAVSRNTWVVGQLHYKCFIRRTGNFVTFRCVQGVTRWLLKLRIFTSTFLSLFKLHEATLPELTVSERVLVMFVKFLALVALTFISYTWGTNRRCHVVITKGSRWFSNCRI